MIGKWKSRGQQHTTILDVDDISCYATRNNKKKNGSRNSVHLSKLQTSSKWWIIEQLLKTQFFYNGVFIYIQLLKLGLVFDFGIVRSFLLSYDFAR